MSDDDHRGLGPVFTSMILVKGAPPADQKQKGVSARRKDNLILVDTAETKLCAAQRLTLVAVGLIELTGAWPHPVAGFVIAAFAIHEGKEAWEFELVEDNGDD